MGDVGLAPFMWNATIVVPMPRWWRLRIEASWIRSLARQIEASMRFSAYERDGIVAVRPRRVGVAAAPVELADHFGRQLARDVARRVPAHAVGDEEEPLVFDEREVVLVVGPLATDVGPGCVADAHDSAS